MAMYFGSMRAFTAIIEKCSETGLYVGLVPGFPGAHTQGESLDELQSNLQEVITMLMDENGSRNAFLPLAGFSGTHEAMRVEDIADAALEIPREARALLADRPGGGTLQKAVLSVIFGLRRLTVGSTNCVLDR